MPNAHSLPSREVSNRCRCRWLLYLAEAQPRVPQEARQFGQCALRCAVVGQHESHVYDLYGLLAETTSEAADTH